jgi:hypothetical protein
MMQLTTNIAMAKGLPKEEQKELGRLIDIFNKHQTANALKRRYYEGHIKLSEVNLGLALPKNVTGLEIGCAWGEKAVDVLAARSMFDGYVGANGEDASLMSQIATQNRMIAEYMKASKEELKYGCVFGTLSADRSMAIAGAKQGCRIRFHTPENAAAEWDGEKGRIGCGFAIIALSEDPNTNERRPSLIHFHTETDLWIIRRGMDDFDWRAERHPHIMGRPLMEPLVWNATAAKPFGRSRLKEPERRLMQAFVRTVCNATIGLEFATSPQKYLLGVTEDQYETLVNEKFQQYVGAIIASTTNPETGEKPSFGQLQQGNITPHVEMLKKLAESMAAATHIPVTEFGVVTEANPMSSDAILAQSQELVALAEQLNSGNGDSLSIIAKMAQAIALDVPMSELTEDQAAVMPHFKNPAMPSVAVTADAAVKIAAARQGFGQTDVFLEMIGFDQADIRRIKSQESRARGVAFLNELEAEEETGETA